MLIKFKVAMLVLALTMSTTGLFQVAKAELTQGDTYYYYTSGAWNSTGSWEEMETPPSCNGSVKYCRVRIGAGETLASVLASYSTESLFKGSGRVDLKAN